MLCFMLAKNLRTPAFDFLVVYAANIEEQAGKAYTVAAVILRKREYSAVAGRNRISEQQQKNEIFLGQQQ